MAAPLKHRWRLGHNYLSGITLGRWLRLLRENRFGVDAAYWHRGAFITLVSGFNSAAARAVRRRMPGLSRLRRQFPKAQANPCGE